MTPGKLLSTKLLALFPVLVACRMSDASEVTARPDPATSPVTAPRVGTAADRASIAAGEQEFATHLFAALPHDQNVFVSPTSVRVALAMTYAGAKGETATQMETVLGLHGSRQAIHDGFAVQLRDLASESSEPKQTVRVVNRLWAQKGRPFQADYLALLDRNYAAPLAPLDFHAEPEKSRQTINAFIEDRTEHKIKDLLPGGAVKNDTRLVLTNAVYFKAGWQRPFEESATVDAPFFLTTSKTAPVKMMTTTSSFRYAKTADAQVVELPYASGKMSMMIVLPTAKDGLGALERSISDASIASWTRALSSTQVDVKLPRFTMTSHFSLGAPLSAMGMPSAFDPSKADFSGIDGTRELVLGDVVHQAFVAVDEHGTEAAAATAVVAVAGAAMQVAPPVELRADHPFVFFIRDAQGSVLFMGRVVDPSPQR